MIAPSRDTHNNWNDKDPVILEGVLGFTKDRLFSGSLEYFIGDGVHKYSELMKYAAAPASTNNDPNTLVLRDANGKIDSDSIDFSTVPDATPTTKGIVKASTTKAADNAVKSDANGALDGWKDAIIDAITDDNGSGGLIADPDTGDLMVDFSQMPTDKFEALLKGLKMKIPMDASTKKNYYVHKSHANASDNTEDITVGNVTYKRGDESYPFKTIQACVNYITETYAIGAYNVVIYISGDTYIERVTLPNYDRTTGSITLQATNNATPPTIQITEGVGNVITVLGGEWKLQRLVVSGTFTLIQDDTANYCTGLSADRGANVLVYGCSFSGEYTGTTPVRYYRVILIGVNNNATITFFPFEGYQTELSLIKGNASVGFFASAGNYGQILTGTGNDAFNNTTVDEYDIACSGSCTTFATASTTGRVARRTGGLYNMFFSGTVTGKKYDAQTGGSFVAPVGGFPGDVTGTVDSSTYCWYTEASS